jgi:hypothetical protein
MVFSHFAEDAFGDEPALPIWSGGPAHLLTAQSCAVHCHRTSGN